MIAITTLDKKLTPKRTEDLKDPKTMALADMKLPVSTILSVTEFNKNGGIYPALKKPKFFLVPNYSVMESKVKKSPLIYKHLSRSYEEQYGMENMLNNELGNIPDRNDIVLSYEGLSRMYTIHKSKSQQYDIAYNLLASLCSDANDGRYGFRFTFYYLTIPEQIPTIDDVYKMLKYEGFKQYNKIVDKDFYPILELIKFLIEGYDTDSPYRFIEESRLSFFRILYRSGDRVSMFKLIDLVQMSETFKLSNKAFNKIDDKHIIKYILLALAKLKLAGIPHIDIGEHDSEDKFIEAVNQEASIAVEEEEVKEIPIDTTEISHSIIDAIAQRGVTSKAALKRVKELSSTSIERLKELEHTDDIKKIEPLEYNVNVIDKSIKIDRLTVLDKEYLKKAHNINIEKAILGISSAGFGVTIEDVTRVDNMSNREDLYKFTVTDPTGGKTTCFQHVPVPDEEGNYVFNGNEYTLGKARLDAIIKKINATTVTLTSYYGKLFVKRNSKAKFNISKYISKYISKLSADIESDYNLYVTGNNEVHSVDLPYHYSAIGRETRGFAYKEYQYLFDYNGRNALVKDGDNLKDIETKGVLVASKEDYLVIDKDNNLLRVDKAGKVLEELGKVFTYLGLGTLPLEPITVQILGNEIPLIILLSYYSNLESMLKKYGVEYELSTDLRKLKDNEYRIRFSNAYLYITKNNGFSEFVVSGLAQYEKLLTTVTFETLHSREGVKDLLHMYDIPPRVVNELDALLGLFVDPILKETLKHLKEPTEFVPILVKAGELLYNDNYKNPNHITTFMFKSHEVLAGMMYTTMSKAARATIQKLGSVRSKFNIDPYSLFKMLNGDSMFQLLEDTNPLEHLKQKAVSSISSFYGRGKSAIATKDRIFDPSAVGTLALDTKDSADIGVTTYLTANPSIDNIYGVPDVEDLTAGNTLSVSSLVSPKVLTDDGKRQLFVSIQHKHQIATEADVVAPYRTGADAIVAYRTDNKFARHVEDGSGEVIKVTKTSVVIKYKDEKKAYKLKDRVSKEVGGKTYRHIIKTMLKVGDKVENGDNIYYDSMYFSPDYLNPKRVLLKSGAISRVALTNADDSDEDASNISLDYHKRLNTNLSKIKDSIIPIDISIEGYAKLGDKVTYDSNLLLYKKSTLLDSILTIENQSEASKAVEDNLSVNKFKAEASGEVIRIFVVYNPIEGEELSNSIKEFIEYVEGLAKKNKAEIGVVDNTYSIQGKPLLEGTMFVKYYIEKRLNLYSGDKFKIGNQLKTTVANVYDKMITESGLPVDLEYGIESVSARIVSSMDYMGAATTLADKYTDDIVKAYNG